MLGRTVKIIILLCMFITVIIYSIEKNTLKTRYFKYISYEKSFAPSTRYFGMLAILNLKMLNLLLSQITPMNLI